jgi:hypothetical protein
VTTRGAQPHRGPDDQRHLDRLLVEHHLGEHAMLAHHLAMIGRVDNPGVVEKTAPLRGLQDPVDAVIDHGDVAVVKPADVGDNGIGQVRRIAVHEV